MRVKTLLHSEKLVRLRGEKFHSAGFMFGDAGSRSKVRCAKGERKLYGGGPADVLVQGRLADKD